MAVGAIEQRLVFREGRVETVPSATVVLSIDHRLINGAEAAEFLQQLKQIVETYERRSLSIRQFLLDLYRGMVRIRRFEERVKFLFLEGVMPGTIHQCQGQEACAVGVCAALRPDDVITSTHRPHGHALAKGITTEEAMAELFARTTGCCHGKGGSMHLGDLGKGMVPAVAIVGGGIPIATGMALAFKMRKEKRVAVCFMGDGAVNEGAFHEGVNMGAIWDLPVVYVVENNLYGASTPVSWVMKTKTIAERSRAYGIPGVTIDGNDVLAVYEAAKRRSIGRAQGGRADAAWN